MKTEQEDAPGSTLEDGSNEEDLSNESLEIEGSAGEPTEHLTAELIRVLRKLETNRSDGKNTKHTYYGKPETHDLVSLLARITGLNKSAVVNLALQSFARDLVLDDRHPAMVLLDLADRMQESARSWDRKIEETMTICSELLTVYLDAAEGRREDERRASDSDA